MPNAPAFINVSTEKTLYLLPKWTQSYFTVSHVRGKSQFTEAMFLSQEDWFLNKLDVFNTLLRCCLNYFTIQIKPWFSNDSFCYCDWTITVVFLCKISVEQPARNLWLLQNVRSCWIFKFVTYASNDFCKKLD